MAKTVTVTCGRMLKQTDRSPNLGRRNLPPIAAIRIKTFVRKSCFEFFREIIINNRSIDGWLAGWMVADDSRLHYTAPTDHINICIPRVHFLSIERSASLTLFWRTHHSQSVIINSERVQLILVIFRFIHILLLY